MSRLIQRFVVFVLLLVAVTSVLMAQVDVTASGGTPSASYTTLKGAFDAVNAGTHTGTIEIGISANTTEIASAVLSASGTVSSSYTSVSIHPTAAGVTITGAIAGVLVDLSGADNVSIDGRQGLSGSTRDLTIENSSTNAAAAAIRFINDATADSLIYLTIKGAGAGTSTGVIVFSTTTGTTGNDDNVITNCDITNSGANFPNIGFYSAGTAAKENSNVKVLNSSISNFRGGTSTHAGINLSSNNTGWTIDGNSFFMTGAGYGGVASTTATGILIVGTGNGYVVQNNYIGGSAASATGTWTVNSTATTYRFVGINISAGTSVASSIQNNTIKNITWLSSSGAGTVPGVMTGIYVQTGLINVGTTTGNTIGSSTGTGSLTANVTNTGGMCFGIANASTSANTISNNIIGSVTVTGNTTSISHGAIGIVTSSGNTTISNNSIGSTSTSNSINASTASTNTTGQPVVGIWSSSTGTVSITNNTVANLNNAYAGTGTTLFFGQIRGILVGSALSTSVTTINTSVSVTGNSIYSLSTASPYTGTSSTSANIGLCVLVSSTSVASTISQNIIYGLSSTTTASTELDGIFLTSGSLSSGSHTVAKNKIHSLSSSSTNIATVMNGIKVTNGTNTFSNNMVRLGIDAAGASLTNNIQINGVFDFLGTNSYYHNSVYVGGTGLASSSSATFAFQSSVTTNVRAFQNNIFVNARSNASGTGKHYAIKVSGTGVNPTGLTCNYNIFYAPGTGGVLGLYSTDKTTLNSWQTATGQDANSGNGDPNFILPGGTSATVDLHVQSSTPAEGSGTAVASITDDIDGDTRASNTPVDIGADAGTFTASDIFPPNISFTVFANTASTGDRTLSATITDVTGVPTVGSLVPRVYYSKSWAGTKFSQPGTLNTGDGNNGTWNFTITASDMGGLAANDSVWYYVIAQDNAGTPNIASRPSGVTATDVNTVTVHPNIPNAYKIVPSFSGSISVGTGQTYTSLSATSGGLFAAINTGTVTGNITVSIVSNTTEDGANALNQWTEEGAGSYTLTIQPSSAAEYLLSGSSATGLIRFNNADRVTIDGRSGGSGMYLRLRNTSSSAAAVSYLGDASNHTLQYCYVEGAVTSTTSGVIYINGSALAQNPSNITIANNTIRDRSDLAGIPANGIYSQGYIQNGAFVSTVTIQNNTLLNFTNGGIVIGGTGSSNYNSGFTISGNDISGGTGRTAAMKGIQFAALGTNTISGNTIHDCGTTNAFIGIDLNDARSTTVSANRLYSITSGSGATQSVAGIQFSGASGTAATVTLVNNVVSIVPGFTNAQNVYGIKDFGYTGNTLTVNYNSVYVAGTSSGSTSSWAYIRTPATPTTTSLTNNIFYNARTGGTGSHFALGDQSNGTGTFTVSNNLYVGTGATAANYMDRGTVSAGTAESFSAWQTAKSDNNSYGFQSSAITNFFTSVTDLHVNASALYSIVPNRRGSVIATTTDYDGAARDGSSPDIGADEFTASPVVSTSITLPAGNYDNLTVNGSGITAALGSALTLPGTLTLTNGLLSISAFDLTLSGSVSGGSSASFITTGSTGTVKRSIAASGSFQFPVGKSSYNPVTVALGGSDPTETFSVRVEDSVNPSATDNTAAVQRTWDISEASAGGNNATLSFQWDAANEGGVFNRSSAAVWHHNGSDWVNVAGGTTSGSDPYTLAAVASVSSFSPFIVGNDAALPVELTSFSAVMNGRKAELKWNTATETNNKGFDVERAVKQEENNASWTKIGSVDGNGTSSSAHAYSYQDAVPAAGKFQYRLKQIDNNGNIKYSQTVEVVAAMSAADYQLSQNYPNPFNPTTNFSFAVKKAEQTTLKVYNILGAEVASLFNDVAQPDQMYTVSFNGSNLSSGTYFYILRSSSRNEVKKMLLMK